MYIHIHGFLSSSKSKKAQQLKTWLTERGRGDEWLCPDLPINPTDAIKLLSDIIEANSDKPIKLIGSSLGGFYATALSERYNLKAVIVNPAVDAGFILHSSIGSHQAWNSDDKLIFTQADIDALNILNVPVISKPENFFLMVEKGDEVLDYRLAVALYHDCQQLIFNGGNHGFSRFVQVLPID